MGDEEKEFDSSCIPSAYPLNDRSIIDHYYRMTGPYCRSISASTPPPSPFRPFTVDPFGDFQRRTLLGVPPAGSQVTRVT